MINAKKEFLEHIGSRAVKCASIGKEVYFEDKILVKLKCGYTKSQYARFEAQLSFEYSNGYGGQELCGTIWYTDGTWSERSEYDGSEWWEHNECPEIPTELGALK